MSGAVPPPAHMSSWCLYGQIFIVLAPQWHGLQHPHPQDAGAGDDGVARTKFDFGHRQAGRCIGHDNGLSGLMKCGQHLE